MASNDILSNALLEMERSGVPIFGPVSFQKYLAAADVNNRDTAQYISVDSLRRLDPLLRRANTMVFRLGSPDGERNTHFALAKCVEAWTDYFLIDEQIFGSLATEAFIPPVSLRRLFAFTLLPAFTETSLVNLAMASGLLVHALKLEKDKSTLIPATGQGTYSFNVKPHAALKANWTHSRGQIQIDGVFIARRLGKETVFVVEAKAGSDLDSLAKHKVAYPLLVLALRPKVPEYLQITGVYMRAICKSDGIHFYIAECRFEPENEEPAIALLKAKPLGKYVVAGLNNFRREST